MVCNQYLTAIFDTYIYIYIYIYTTYIHIFNKYVDIYIYIHIDACFPLFVRNLLGLWGCLPYLDFDAPETLRVLRRFAAWGDGSEPSEPLQPTHREGFSPLVLESALCFLVSARWGTIDQWYLPELFSPVVMRERFVSPWVFESGLNVDEHSMYFAKG